MSCDFAGGHAIERLTVFALLLCVGSVATGEVSTTVYLADGSTPLELADPNVSFVYRDIMVGTKLTIVVSSDTAESPWSGKLQIAGTDRDYGAISARDYNDVTLDWEGSHLEAAGIGAKVFRSASVLGISINMETRDAAAPGDWFIIDYTSTNVGNCRVGFYEVVVEPCPNCDPFKPPPFSEVLVNDLAFSHVPTRDFIRDGKVDFADFAALTAFVGATNCVDLNWCEGTDLDADGDVDNVDLMLFADYWLESTE
jgi:hypothetical protein